MATGKKALDIFQRTTGKRPVIGLEVAERMGRGRPGAGEPYQKVTVTLYDRQILMLDKVALAFRERTGEFTNRAELIRVIIDQAAAVDILEQALEYEKRTGRPAGREWPQGG